MVSVNNLEKYRAQTLRLKAWSGARDRLRNAIPLENIADFDVLFDPVFNDMKVTLEVKTADGKTCKFTEPADKFPSDELLTQIALVAAP